MTRYHVGSTCSQHEGNDCILVVSVGKGKYPESHFNNNIKDTTTTSTSSC